MPSRSKQGIYENVYEIVGLAGREKERAKDIHETRMLCSNPSKWEDWLRGCFISRIVSRLFLLLFDDCLCVLFLVTIFLDIFFLLLIAYFTHDCSSCSLLRLTSNFHKIQDNRLKFTRGPIHSESIADLTALLAQEWTVGYSQRFTAKRVTHWRVDPPLMRLNRSTLRTWTACR